MIFDKYCQEYLFKLKTTGEIIRGKREQKGLLLRQLAAFIDVDIAILSKIERGERKPTREQIIKIAELLGLNKDEFLIQYLSEKIAYEISEEDNALEVLREAESKIEYLKQSRR